MLKRNIMKLIGKRINNIPCNEILEHLNLKNDSEEFYRLLYVSDKRNMVKFKSGGYVFILLFLIFFPFFKSHAQQFQIDEGIDSRNIFFDNDTTQIFWGKIPILSLPLSNIIIDSEKGLFNSEKWHELNQGSFKPQIIISEYKKNIFHFEIEMMIDSSLELNDISLQFNFLPKNQGAWIKCKKDFHWIPNIKADSFHIASDHVFRSPVTFIMTDTIGAALIPDLDLIGKSRPAPYYMNLKFPKEDSPEIIFGISNYTVQPHQYYSKSEKTFHIKKGKLNLGFYLIISQNISKNELLRGVNGFLWEKFGRSYTFKHEPQTVLFAQYATYGYKMALENLWVKANYPNTGGITLSTYFDKKNQKWGGRYYPDDLWFHSWFNNLRTAYGLYMWGKRTSNEEWKKKAIAVRNLILNSPTKRGFFKTIYNTKENTWITSGQGGGENVYHLPDNSWTAFWLLKFDQECEHHAKTNQFLLDYANALLLCQHPDGSFPTRLFADDLKPDSVLDKSASEGLSLWLLAEMRLRGIFPDKLNHSVDDAIKKGLDHIEREILPRQKFEDFELYFSCSPKPLDFYDPVTEMYGQNTLSIQWCAEAFRMGYQLFNRQKDYESAIHCIELLCLYQQIWNPPYLSFYAFGGFGVMNTDAEWNDARQAQFAVTLANFYDLTGNREYMERAISAAKASFTLMAIDENKNIAPLNYKGTSRNFEIHGGMAENYGHCGEDCRSFQSGFHWGTGSALCTSIILQNRYGDIFINSNGKHVFGMNGVVINSVDFRENKTKINCDFLIYDTDYSGRIMKTDEIKKFSLKINDKEVPFDNLGNFEVIPHNKEDMNF